MGRRRAICIGILDVIIFLSFHLCHYLFLCLAVTVDCSTLYPYDVFTLLFSDPTRVFINYDDLSNHVDVNGTKTSQIEKHIEVGEAYFYRYLPGDVFFLRQDVTSIHFGIRKTTLFLSQGCSINNVTFNDTTLVHAPSQVVERNQYVLEKAWGPRPPRLNLQLNCVGTSLENLHLLVESVELFWPRRLGKVIIVFESPPLCELDYLPKGGVKHSYEIVIANETKIEPMVYHASCDEILIVPFLPLFVFNDERKFLINSRLESPQGIKQANQSIHSVFTQIEVHSSYMLRNSVCAWTDKAWNKEVIKYCYGMNIRTYVVFVLSTWNGARLSDFYEHMANFRRVSLSSK